jgi:SAM-dependent methyltransferase
MIKEKYLEHNADSWNKRLESHLKSDFYNLEEFKKGWCSLNPIDLELLGNLSGKKVLHLQCHFGQDTLSMTRYGAECTGIDLAEKAIEKALSLSEELALPARFIHGNVLDTIDLVGNEKFDVVFASYGTIIWLPELRPWAKSISHVLKPGGKLVFIDFHPFLWTLDEKFKSVKYGYSNKSPIVETETGTYADPEAKFQTTNVTWNHTVAELWNALKDAGLAITHLEELDYSPYPCFPNLRKEGERMYRFKHFKEPFPMVLALKAKK